jgi:hypothetical protein
LPVFLLAAPLHAADADMLSACAAVADACGSWSM